MIQEDKELLLKDLSARLSYGVLLNVPIDGDGHFADRQLVKVTIEDEYPIVYVLVKKSEDPDCASLLDGYFILDTKPYLRPLSSMTREESRHYDIHLEELSLRPSVENADELMSWLYENHFDCHNLIEKGLALEAPDEMYK